jgi:hypothetical protein
MMTTFLPLKVMQKDKNHDEEEEDEGLFDEMDSHSRRRISKSSIS